MKTLAHLLLILLVALVLPMHRAASAQTACPHHAAPAMQHATMAGMACHGNQDSAADKAAHQGEPCNGAACGFCLSAPPVVALSIPVQPAADFPPVVMHFRLQDFPQARLRPPRLT